MGAVRLNRHEIVGDDSEVVSINCELLSSFSASIDQPESVLLSGSKLECWDAGVIGFAWCAVVGCLLRAVKETFSLDKIAVRFDKLYLSVPSPPMTEIFRTTYNSRNIGRNNIFHKREIIRVIPVSKENRTNV